MPDWTTNYVTVTGDEANIDRFIIEAFEEDAELTEGRRIDFARIVPQPANIETTGCSGQHAEGEVCWYTWNGENWGTKWNACNTRDFNRVAPEQVNFRFDTAWCAPSPIFDAIKERWAVKVHVISLDEGGGETEEYGQPHEYMNSIRTVEWYG